MDGEGVLLPADLDQVVEFVCAVRNLLMVYRVEKVLRVHLGGEVSCAPDTSEMLGAGSYFHSYLAVLKQAGIELENSRPEDACSYFSTHHSITDVVVVFHAEEGVVVQQTVEGLQRVHITVEINPA